jgi:hypothetical protein
MQRVQPLPALTFGAILAFGAAVAYALHRVSADVAAVTVLGCSATLACVTSSVLSVIDQWYEACTTWLKRFHSPDNIDFCTWSNCDAAKEKK